MMSRLLGEGHKCPVQPFLLTRQLAVQPFLLTRLIDFNPLGYLLDRCLLTSTPYGSRWVSTFILCHVFDVEVSLG